MVICHSVKQFVTTVYNHNKSRDKILKFYNYHLIYNELLEELSDAINKATTGKFSLPYSILWLSHKTECILINWYSIKHS